MAKSDDDSKRPGKKISISDWSGAMRRTAPELDDKDNKATEVTDDVESTTKSKEPAEDVESDTTADPKTDRAVDEILKHDSDEVLQAEDEKTAKAVATNAKLGFWGSIKHFWKSWWASPRKRWSTIAVLVAAVAAVFVVPVTRYNTLGLVLTADVTVRAVDSKSGKPVSGATVQLAGQKAETNAEGRAVLRVHMGSREISVSKKYYTGSSKQAMITLSATSNTFTVRLVATGRQVNVKLVNAITNQPVADASIASKGSTAKTDKDGQATLVIDSGATTQEASVSLNGFNTAKVNVAADGDLAKNTFKLTPAGKLYFLSNLSGKLDVVKTNLDGSDRQVVLAGTGSEDKYNTSLLASRDWKYLALFAKRSGDHASIYLIDTTNGDLLTTIDEGNAEFTLAGWSGNRFIYRVARNSVEEWQANKYALKSFDPTTGHTLLLDQTQASGTSINDYASQNFTSVYLVGSQVVYLKGWSGFGMDSLNGKAAELHTISADGSGHKVLKSFVRTSSLGYYFRDSFAVESRLYEPDGIYLWFNNAGTDTFYEYEAGSVNTTDEVTAGTFWNDAYATYLLSPSSNQTFWAESRDGKNTLFIGNAAGKNAKQVASLSEHYTYGWYTDDYLLVSKDGSELYIMSATGGTPVKITDYYRPGIAYYGYGGGYGGL